MTNKFCLARELVVSSELKAFWSNDELLVDEI